jgi:hypothetical protein
MKTKGAAPHFGSTDLLVEGFFSQLQDHFNVNTVPTVIRLTSKLLKTEITSPYPFCPLCLGLRDNINNLLEVGSTIKSIENAEESKVCGKVESVKSAEEWFSSDIERAFCFGCKRMAIEAIDK